MRISIAEAEGQLTELVKLATQGEEVVLTQDGGASVRLEPVGHGAHSPPDMTSAIEQLRKPITLANARQLSLEERRAAFDRIREMAPPWDGTDAARSQDFLYDEDGLPK